MGLLLLSVNNTHGLVVTRHPTQRSSNGGLSYIGCYDSISSDTYQEKFFIRAQSLLTRRFVFETCCNWLRLLLLLEMELLSTTFSLSSGRTCIRKMISVPTPSILLSWAAWLGFIHTQKITRSRVRRFCRLYP